MLVYLLETLNQLKNNLKHSTFTLCLHLVAISENIFTSRFTSTPITFEVISHFTDNALYKYLGLFTYLLSFVFFYCGHWRCYSWVSFVSCSVLWCACPFAICWTNEV